MARNSDAARPAEMAGPNLKRSRLLSRGLGQLLRSVVGADEKLLGWVPTERRNVNILSGALLLSALLGAAILAVGLGEAGVGAAVSVTLVVIFLVAYFVTGRIVASTALVLDRTRRWRLGTGILMNLVITVPMSFLTSDLLLLRIFAADAGTGGLLTRLANVNTLLHGSDTGGTILWAVRAVVFGVLILPVVAILAAPLSTYARLLEAHQHAALKIEEERVASDRRLKAYYLQNKEQERLEEERQDAFGRRVQAHDLEVAEEVELRVAVDRLAEQMLRSGDS